NCRNTRRISQFCSTSIGHDIKVKPGTPEGQNPKICVAESSEKQKQAVTSCLKGWLSGTSGLSKKQIAILSPMALAQSSLRNLASLAGIPLTDDLSVWRAGQAVLLTTVRKFKGLEADAVVLFDVQEDIGVS